MSIKSEIVIKGEVALMDSCFAPVIESVYWREYTGQKGELIPVYAFDDSGVVEVYLTIMNARGQKLESGVALPSNHFGEWLYRVKRNNRAIDGCVIRIVAMDHPGNKTKLTIKLPG